MFTMSFGENLLKNLKFYIFALILISDYPYSFIFLSF